MILKIPINLISLEAEGYHLFIKAELNGKPANLLIDTGASKTVFDINRISKFVRKGKKSFESFEKLSTGLGTNSMESHHTTVKKFCLGYLTIENFQVILLDMGHVNQSYEMMKLTPIDGVLGSDILMKYKAIIDFDKLLLKLKI